jgi:hypothetical protein
MWERRGKISMIRKVKEMDCCKRGGCRSKKKKKIENKN